MGHSLIGRRAAIAGAGAFAAAALGSRAGLALGRIPLGGTVKMRLPWSTASIDPHNLHDAMAGFLGHAIADPVFALDSRGRAYPTLADGMPKVQAGQTVVRLRAGLRSATGKAIGGRDLAWSVKRARNMGAVGLVAKLTRWVRSDRSDPLVVRFGTIDPAILARTLASPLLSLLPLGFSPTRPDGTGAFRAVCSPTKLELLRNPYAARGPSFLDRVVVQPARSMSDSLRAFESERDDVGWLGMGLHGRRKGARKFDYGVVAWVVLATGRLAGAFGAPGAAQQLANMVPVERLGLGLQPRRGVRAGSGWFGDPTSLYFDASSPQLKHIAAAVAAKLSSSGHEVTPRGVQPHQLRRLRARGSYALALDVVRHPMAGILSPLVALATADSIAMGRDVSRTPPRVNYRSPLNHLTTSLRVGVLGGLAVRGGTAPAVALGVSRRGRGFDLGSSFRS